MIFKIADGREHFYQWDIDRQIIVSDLTIKEVHFCNRTDVCSLVVEVVDGTANVPNKVLQSGFAVKVFGYDGKATMHEATFEVKARTQPTDYVYTEVEIKRYSDLEKRIDEIEEKGFSEEVINNAVSEYLAENPITMEGYATEDYVDNAVKNVEVDLTGYATEEYVDEAISNIKIPEGSDIDLTGYATEEWVKDQGYLKEHIDISGKADKDHVHLSYALKTEIPSVEGLATEEYVDNAIANIEIPESPGGDGGNGTPLYQHTVYVGSTTMYGGFKQPSVYVSFICSRAEAFTFSSFVSYLHSTGSTLAVSGTITNNSNDFIPVDIIKTNTAGNSLIISYRTSDSATPTFNTYTIKESDAASLFSDTVVLIGSAAVTGGGSADLSDYYTKEETEALIPDVSNFISEIPAEYVTETELEAKGYLTEHQSLEGYATETFVSEAIAAIDIPDTDLTNYYTKDETYSKTEVDSAIAAGGGGGSGGSGVRIIKIANNIDLTDDEKAAIYQFYTEAQSTGNIPNNIVFYVAGNHPKAWVPVNTIQIGTGGYITLKGEDLISAPNTTYLINCTLCTTSETACSKGVSYGTVATKGDWQYTSDEGDYSLYNAKEIYILVRDWVNDYYIFSYVTFNGILGDQTYLNFTFTTSNAMDNSVPYWNYDGSVINFYGFDNGKSVKIIAYKA